MQPQANKLSLPLRYDKFLSISVIMTAARVQQSSSAPQKERTGSSLVHLGRHFVAARVVVLTSSAVGRPMEVVHGEFLCGYAKVRAEHFHRKESEKWLTT